MSSSDYPPFVPRAPWYGPDLQTLRNLVRGPALQSSLEGGETVELPLGDGSGDRLVARVLRPPEAVPDRPVVVLVHGLGGSEDSTYLKVSASHLLAQGVRVALLNLRGAGPSRIHCTQQYHAGRTGDFRDAVNGLPEDLKNNGVVAAGFSLGGNMLLKYAAEFGGLRGVVSVSAPIDLRAASYRFLDARNRIYHAYLLAGMKREALGEGAIVSDEERRILPGLRSILEFDEQIVAPRGGFADADDYYAQNHARQFLPAIRIPALIIHALNDPWIPASAYTSFDWSSSPALTPLLPRSGGHVGFHGRGGHVPWYDRCISRFLETL